MRWTWCAQGTERRPLWFEFVKGRGGWDSMRSQWSLNEVMARIWILLYRGKSAEGFWVGRQPHTVYSFFSLKLQYNWCTILYKLAVNKLFTIFKGYTSFIVILKYWLHSLCCTIYPCSLCIILYFLITKLYFPSPQCYWKACSLYLCLLLFVIITSLLYFLYSTHKWYQTVFVCLCLIYFI